MANVWLGLQLPALALEAVPGDDSVPRVLADTRVLLVNAAAHAAGIQPGCSVATALALAPQLQLVAPDAERAALLLDALALRLGQVTSTITMVEDGPALLGEIAGSASLFGGIPNVVKAALRAFEGSAVTLHWAVATTPGAALLLASERPGTLVVDPQRLSAALAPLPVQCLPFAQTQIDQLLRVGARRIDDVLQLPRASLARRMGPASVLVLDRLVGAAADPRERWVPPETFSRRLEWTEAVESIEALSFPLRRLAGDLAAYLQLRGERATCLTLRLEHEHAAASEIEIPAANGTADADQLFTLSSHLLSAHGLPAPVIAAAITLTSTRETAAASHDLFQGSAGERAAALIERLQARLGRQAVYGVQPGGDPRPEMAQRRIPVGGTDATSVRQRRRPAWLLAVPRPLPTAATGLTLLAGPERIESGWWDGADIRRDYYLARNHAGQTLWVYRDVRDGSWSLHGMFG